MSIRSVSEAGIVADFTSAAILTGRTRPMAASSFCTRTSRRIRVRYVSWKGGRQARTSLTDRSGAARNHHDPCSLIWTKGLVSAPEILWRLRRRPLPAAYCLLVELLFVKVGAFDRLNIITTAVVQTGLGIVTEDGPTSIIPNGYSIKDGGA